MTLMNGETETAAVHPDEFEGGTSSVRPQQV
jgi:hypothetical protein